MAQEQQFHVGVKALIQNDSGELLLFLEDVSKHSIPTEPYWDFAGGRMQDGESVLDALSREVAEETGIRDVLNPRFRAATISNHRIKVSDDLTVGLVLMVYEVTIPNDAAIALSDEHTSYEWVTLAEAKQRLAHKYPQDFIDQL